MHMSAFMRHGVLVLALVALPGIAAAEQIDPDAEFLALFEDEVGHSLYAPVPEDTQAVPNALAPLPRRTLIFDAMHPMDSLEANTRAWYSLTQVSARGSDYLSIRREWSRSLASRGLLTFLSLNSIHAIGFVSHEMAHELQSRSHGGKKTLTMDLSTWESSGIVLFHPLYIQHPVTFTNGSNREASIFSTYEDALNLNALSARFIWERMPMDGQMDVWTGLTFMESKLSQLMYFTTSGMTDRRMGLSGADNETVVEMAFKTGAYDDLDMYTNFLQNRGIHVSKMELLGQILLADLASWPLWESGIATGRYILKGERTYKPFSFQLTKDTSITPPLVSTYFTEDGTFYDAAFMVHHAGGHPVMISLGTGVDFIGDGDRHRLRFGVKTFNLPLGDHVRCSPFAYVNFGDESDHRGASVGMDLELKLSGRMSLTARAEFNDDDLIENEIKHEEKGLSVAVGLRAAF